MSFIHILLMAEVYAKSVVSASGTNRYVNALTVYLPAGDIMLIIGELVLQT